jgi:iron complex transport system substrate-binding protein
VKRLPICTATKFVTDGTSYEIDQRVKAILQEGLSVYRVDAEKLNQLRPDIIITQTQCEVCAVSLRDVEAAVCSLIDSKPQIVSLQPNALANVWLDIMHVAEALGIHERGRTLVQQLQQRIAAIAETAQALPNKPRVACIEWIEPLMAAGNWMPELVQMAGGLNLFGEAGKHSPWMTWEQLCEKDPDIILVLPCGFDIPRTRQEMPVLMQKPEWPQLQAVRKRRVFLADGNQYFNRPGPRLVESLEILAEIFHPGILSFNHAGAGWQLL